MVQQAILETLPSAKLKVYAVWTPVLKEDDRQAAVRATAVIPDERVVHLWDADKSLGQAFGKVVALPRGRTLAWDVYFAFDHRAQWGHEPPQPAEWMHQLGIDERLFDGDKLRASVETLLGATR